MSRMELDGKPPLAISPIRLRPQRSLRSNSSSMETSLSSISKSQLLSRSWDIEEPELPPEYQSISCELLALAKMVKHEFGRDDVENVGFANTIGAKSSPLFERGRFYEVDSARRNERLKRKKGGETGDDRKTTTYDLGVNVESSKRRDSKKFESARKSMSAFYSSVDRSEHPRYSLRSSSCKENKKPPLAVKFEKSVVEGDRKIGARRVGGRFEVLD